MFVSLQEEREWEQEVEDARRAQIESREAKRVKEEADEPAEPAVDDEELALSELPSLLASQSNAVMWLYGSIAAFRTG